MLSLDAPPPISFAAFQHRCHDELSPADFAAVQAIARDTVVTETTEPAPTMPRFYRRWHAVETQIRNAVATRRGRTANVAAAPYRRNHDGYRVDIEQAVDAAFAQSSPFDRERALDGLRWRLLEELGGTDPFTSDALLAYACRLRLSERWAGLTPETGQAAFQETLTKIIDETSAPNESTTATA